MKKYKYIKLKEYFVNNNVYILFTVLCLGFISKLKTGNKYINFIHIICNNFKGYNIRRIRT